MKEPRIRYSETGEPITDEYFSALDTYETTLDDKFEFDREEKTTEDGK